MEEKLLNLGDTNFSNNVDLIFAEYGNVLIWHEKENVSIKITDSDDTTIELRISSSPDKMAKWYDETSEELFCRSIESDGKECLFGVSHGRFIIVGEDYLKVVHNVPEDVEDNVVDNIERFCNIDIIY